jgi:transposase-like protein
MSKPVERVETISGRERRRRYSAKEKVRLVEQTRQPGTTVSAVARLHGVSPSLLFHRRRRAVEGRHVRAGWQERHRPDVARGARRGAQRGDSGMGEGAPQERQSRRPVHQDDRDELLPAAQVPAISPARQRGAAPSLPVYMVRTPIFRGRRPGRHPTAARMAEAKMPRLRTPDALRGVTLRKPRGDAMAVDRDGGEPCAVRGPPLSATGGLAPGSAARRASGRPG